MAMLFLFPVFVTLVLAEKHNACCGPYQFEAQMSQFGEAYNPQTHTTVLIDDYIDIKFDYNNKRSAMFHHAFQEDGSMREFKVILDYLRHRQYEILDGANCTEMLLDPAIRMIEPCVPHNASYIGTSLMGYGNNMIRMDTWTYDVHEHAVHVTLDVSPNGCIPILRTLKGTDKGSEEAIAYSFSDYVIGIEKPSVFHIPFDCRQGNFSFIPFSTRRAVQAVDELFR